MLVLLSCAWVCLLSFGWLDVAATPSSSLTRRPPCLAGRAQGRAAKGTLAKCTNDQLKAWLRAKVRS